MRKVPSISGYVVIYDTHSVTVSQVMMVTVSTFEGMTSINFRIGT